MVFTKDNLMELLKNNVMTITFTKVDGTQRIMKCTLIGDHIPNTTKVDGKVVVRENKIMDNNISVWDMEANGWRSFKVDRVQSVSIGVA